MVKLFTRQKESTAAGVRKTRRSWFGRVVGLLDRSKVNDQVWEDVEEALIGADVGVVLTTDLIEKVRGRTSSGEAPRMALQAEMIRMLDGGKSVGPLADSAGGFALPVKPYVILLIGVNGVGKTTSIAKLAQLMTDDGKRVILAAADTFRAAAIEQLAIWGERVGAEVISHQHGADPGAVAFDALEAARARDADVVIIDTAGRLHTKSNLMEELKKINRVIQRFDPSAPHDTILVMDATTGQNGLAQAKKFADTIGLSGVLLAKLDGTSRGGVVLSIVDELHLPILFIGTGEHIGDIVPFDGQEFVEALFAPGA